ncbi:MAG: DUF4365 domain-containing protein [bacterium]|nr:DUF4365 domain-containing protein [bacterium]
MSPDSRWAASSSRDQTLRIWDIESGACLSTIGRHNNYVFPLAIPPDGERILSSPSAQQLRLSDLWGGGYRSTWPAHHGLITSIAAFYDGKRALSGSADKSIRLWNIETGQCLKTLVGHHEAVRCVAVTQDGQRAVSGSSDLTVRYWQLESQECLATLQGHAGTVRSVQITPDGRFAVSGSDDKTIRIWDLESRSCMGTLEGHQQYVHSVALSPDGTLIASAGWSLRLWKLDSGIELQEIKPHPSEAFISVDFSSDGLRLIAGTAGASGYSYVYRLSGVKPVPPAARYVNAKVVLLGESGVGKSGLAHRMIEDRFVPTHSTHGMQVWHLDLPVDSEELVEREALLWDLAGQEDYRLIHQLFLDETALALVLMNPQKEDPFAEVVDWLKALNAAAPANAQRQAIKLLISARTDVGAVKVSQKKIDRFLKKHGFAGYLATSAKLGRDCSDRRSKGNPSNLKKLIAQNIPWSSLPWTSTPRLVRELKNAVLAMCEAEEMRLLRFPELVQRLRQRFTGELFDDVDVRTAVTLLANHALVMPLDFGDLLLLQPQAMNGYASAVIRAARTHVDEIGCVSEYDVFNRNIALDGVDRFASADEDLLLRAMVQTFLDRSLCIAEDTPDGRQLIFPSQYRREHPIPAHPQVFVSYTFSGELATIYTTLVVRLWYSREFDNKELWKDAAEFSTSKGKIAGMLMKKTGEGVATLSVFFEPDVPDELKVVFIGYIHQHLHRYGREVQRDRRYVCLHCGTPIIDLEIVSKRLAARKDFITCQDCDEKVPLIDHIEQRLASDPVAREVLRMDEVASRELDTQALEQILIGHMMAICGEANQIFRPVSMFDYGIDGEIEFRNEDGRASGHKVYVQLKSGDSHLRRRRSDGKTIFDTRKTRHLDYWADQPCDVFLVIRDTADPLTKSSEEAAKMIRWMNISEYLRTRRNKKSRQIVFNGKRLDAAAIQTVRSQYIL